MKKLLVFSCTITVVLILAQVVRWETIESVNSDGTLYIYKEDNWTNQKWVEIYKETFFESFPVPSDSNYDEAYQVKQFLSNSWAILILLSLVLSTISFANINIKKLRFSRINLPWKKEAKKATN